MASPGHRDSNRRPRQQLSNHSCKRSSLAHRNFSLFQVQDREPHAVVARIIAPSALVSFLYIICLFTPSTIIDHKSKVTSLRFSNFSSGCGDVHFSARLGRSLSQRHLPQPGTQHFRYTTFSCFYASKFRQGYGRRVLDRRRVRSPLSRHLLNLHDSYPPSHGLPILSPHHAPHERAKRRAAASAPATTASVLYGCFGSLVGGSEGW